MSYESLGYDSKIIWQGEELVFDLKSNDSKKRLEEYIGRNISIIDDVPVVHTSDFKLHVDRLVYRGKSGKPEQPVGLKNYNKLFQDWEGYSLNLNHWDMSDVVSMESMFERSRRLIEVGIGSWDVRNVKSVKNMFAHCNNLDHVSVQDWNIENMSDVSYMFYQCFNLRYVDISGWDISNVKSLQNMFYHCGELRDVVMPECEIHQSADVQSMFHYCTRLRGFDITEWKKKYKDCWKNDKTEFNGLFGGVAM